jgi:hypothetical protein
MFGHWWMAVAWSSSAVDEQRRPIFLEEVLALLFSDRLAGTVRPRGDRGYGLWNLGTCGATRTSSGDHRRWNIVDSESEAVQAANAVRQLDRRSVRQAFERRFTANGWQSSFSPLLTDEGLKNRAALWRSRHYNKPAPASLARAEVSY